MVDAALTSPVHRSLTLSTLDQRQPRQGTGLAMIRQAFNRLWNDKRGNALMIAGAALPLIVGSAGLATDTIQWTLWKRQLQRAADSAALAGVYARVQNNASQTAAQAVDNDLSRNQHTKIALKSGFPEVTFPTSTDWTNGVQVSLGVQKTLGFSSVFMPTAPTITARATAATIATGVYCVVSLIDTGETGIKATGNGDIDLGCGMITNSTSLTAAIATGSSDVFASPIAAVGNIGSSDNWNGAELLPFTVKQKDPFAEVVPDTSSCDTNPPKLTENTPFLTPGCYSSIDLNGPVALPSGTYIIDGGDLNFGNKANITCTGCTFVLTNKSSSTTATIGDVDFNADAHIELSAPNDATNPYNGIVIYQDRRAESGPSKVNRINGNATSVIGGAFYFPKQQLQINGGAGLEFTCGQFVAYIVEFSGNSAIENTCTAGYGGKSIMGKHVRLVA